MSNYQVIETESNDLAVQADQVIVANQEQYVNAGEFLKSVKDLQKKVDDTFKPIVAKAHAVHKEAKAQHNKYLVPLTTIKGVVEGKMRTWKNEQERKAREEEARLAEKARKEAERLAERARKAEAKGQEEKAEELREQAQDREIFKPTVQSTVPKVEGVILRKNWKFRVVDQAKIPEKYKMVDMVKVGRIVRAEKEDTEIPGIQVYCE
jgi:hypothetical protein